MAARRDPSVSKVQYLMHLHECHEWAAEACTRNADLIAGLFSSPLPLQKHVLTGSESSGRYVNDLRYLADELTLRAHKIDELKEVIVSQIDLLDKRRNRNIGIFLAIYVPLAFATVREFAKM